MNKNESKQTKESGETNPNEIIKGKGKEQYPSRPFYGQTIHRQLDNHSFHLKLDLF